MGQACASGETVPPETVKIEYFNKIHGRAEPLRVLLHHAGVQYVDAGIRIPTWVYRKSMGNTGEMGQLPIVSYQGVEMQQMGAILRSFGI